MRLLDESRSRLLVAARTGSSLHASAHVDFAVGEGLVGWVVANRKPLRVARASEDPRFAPKPGMTSHMGSFLGVPLLDEHGCIGVLATTAQEPLAFSLDDERRLRLVASIVSPRLQVARLHRLVVTDPLTCVWNRRALDDLLPPASPGAASVAAVDIDLFKSINDRLGHAVGDRVLCDVAGALGSALRETDHVVRVGGDEFLLVLRGAALEQAAGIADRARAAVRATQFDGATITVSIGVAASRPGETRDALLARADASLYCAKAGGRDRVEVDAA